jgi:stage V sporulation protein K
MQAFIATNPGLQSRFDHTFVFHDFSHEELRTIALNMLTNAELVPDAAAGTFLDQYLDYLYQNRTQYFGNARSVRKIIDRAIFHQNLRMAALDPAERTDEAIHMVTLEDLKDLNIEKVAPARRAVGFKWG